MSVSNFTVDASGKLWFMNGTTLTRADPATWALTPILDLSKVAPFVGNILSQFGTPAITPDGNVWIFGSGGAFNPQSNALVKISSTGAVLSTFPSTSLGLVQSNLAVAADGSIWFTGNGQLNTVNSSGLVSVALPLSQSSGVLLVLPGGLWTSGLDSTGTSVAVMYSVPVQTAKPLKDGDKCNGSYAGTFKGEIEVKAGQTCVYVSGKIEGAVHINGGSFTLKAGTITGEFEATGGTFSFGRGTSIEGDIEIHDLTSAAKPYLICGATVGGSVQIHDNRGIVSLGDVSGCPPSTIHHSVELHDNTAASGIFSATVGGSVNVHDNKGMVQVFTNKIGENLACNENKLIAGAGNTAEKKHGQCEKF